MKRAQKIIGMVAMLMTSVLAGFNSAQADVEIDLNSSLFWTALTDKITHCAVRPYSYHRSGAKIYGKLFSICSDVVVDDQSSVSSQLLIQGSSVVFRLSPDLSSENSTDGGDLGILTVERVGGEILAVYPNVLAFGDILYALAGDQNFREVYSPDLK